MLRAAIGDEIVPGRNTLVTSHFHVESSHVRGWAVSGSFGEGLPACAYNDGSTGELKIPFRSYSIRGDDMEAIEESVDRDGALRQARQNEVRRVADDIRAPQGQNSPSFGELPVETNEDPDSRLLDRKDGEAQVPGAENVLLVPKEMELPVGLHSPVRANEHGAVVDPVAVPFTESGNESEVPFGSQLLECVDEGPVDRFGQCVGLVGGHKVVAGVTQFGKDEEIGGGSLSKSRVYARDVLLRFAQSGGKLDVTCSHAPFSSCLSRRSLFY